MSECPPGAAAPPVLGGAALLRVAGLPSTIWLASGSGALFDRVRRLEAAQDRYAKAAARAAEATGTWLVPHPALPPGQRGEVLALRRRLHRGERLERAEAAWLAGVAARLLGPGTPLPEGLREVRREAAMLSGLEAEAAAAAAEEEARLLRLPWELALAAPPVERLVLDVNPAAWSDLRDRVQRREPWDSKRVRQRTDYLWRLLDRAAGKSTPRAWFGQVALVLVAADGAGRFPPVLGDGLAVEWLENVYHRRRDRAVQALADGDTAVRLTVAPLRRGDGEHVVFWVVDVVTGAIRPAVNEVKLRRTPLLEATVAALRGGSSTLGELQAALGPAGERERDVLRRFFAHLAGLGVLEASVPAHRRLVGWHAPAAGVAATPTSPDGAGTGFRDVYREVAGPLPPAACQRLEGLVLQALRVAALARLDRQPGDDPVPTGVGEQPRPVLELLGERLDGTRRQGGQPHPRRAWPAASREDSGWARLLAWVSEHADGAAVLDLDTALLDELGAPQVALDWPYDALLRPLPPGDGAEAVLGQVAPAGILDARFASALRALHGHVPHVDAYRRFLAAVEREAGVPFVELLVPPLNERAANAVRRPLLASYWTGDPDVGSYCDARPPGARYLPLDAITVHRSGDRVVAEAEGRTVWPIHHASRTLQPPWHVVGGLLLRASPQPLRHAFPALVDSLPAFPERQAMPRVTVGSGLVLSCAQWRVPAGELWDEAATPLAKARALERLRGRLGLPRFVFVLAGQPLPCDLESLRATRTLERARRLGAGSLLLAEALPAFDRLPVASRSRPAERRAAELLLRLPGQATPDAMAARFACSLREREPVRPTAPARAMTSEERR